MSDRYDRSNGNSYDRYEFRGVKIAHELMVDILGGLIPGAMFLFSVILCIVFPIICYASPGNNNFGFLIKDGDWFWIVVFLSFLILSYVIGHIFYRADIKMPDRADIRREQKKKLKAFIDGMPVGKDYDDKRLRYAANLLYDEIKPLYDALCKYEDYIKEYGYKGGVRYPYDVSFKTHCENAIAGLVQVMKLKKPAISPELRRNILYVLFPEVRGLSSYSPEDSFGNDNESYYPNNRRRRLYFTIARRIFPEIGRLPLRTRSVIINAIRIVPLVGSHTGWVLSRRWRQFRLNVRLHYINRNSIFEHVRLYPDKWNAETANSGNDSQKKDWFNMLMVSYLILHMQNESGCATESRCDFPYMSYFKYLLKRRQFPLLEYADWGTSSERTKNQINKYKIELQLNVPEAYSIINKNESHIRMASSAWHVARTIRTLSWAMIVIMAALAVLAGIYHRNIEITGQHTAPNITASPKKGEVKGELNFEGQLSASRSRMPDEWRSVKEDSGYVTLVEKYIPFISRETITNSYLAIVFPLISLLLALYILRNVPRFIHYQRLREIYYTLTVYKLWQDAKTEIAKREKAEMDIRRAAVNLRQTEE